MDNTLVVLFSWEQRLPIYKLLKKYIEIIKKLTN